MPTHESESTYESDVNALSKDLLRDFYQTFRLSQSETAVQPPLFCFLAQRHAWAGHQDIMSEALARADQEVDRLLPPARHTETTPEGRTDEETGFRAMWQEYNVALTDQPAPNRSLEEILEDILGEELKYQENGRPNRTDRQDRYESILREYILGDRLVGSRQLIEVRDMLRSTLRHPNMETGGDYMVGKLEMLREKWEDHHPGEVFMADVEQPNELVANAPDRE